ncbi:MAG TPA: TolC family protein [Methylomirabilota bacterium]|nr:TolC family protein [Methylomirabilota bacterium]
MKTCLAVLAVALSVSSVAAAASDTDTQPSRGAVESIIKSLDDDTVRALVTEVLERNPRLAALRAEAAAAEQKAPQVAALPDPVAALTLYLQTPETRVGPQQAMVSLSQRFPWFGTLGLREQAAVHDALARALEVEALRLELVTETRRLAHELAYLGAEASIVAQERDTLAHFEELARARYATGVGLGQAVVKIQGEITRADTRLLRIAQRRLGLLAELDALRDRPDRAPGDSFEVPHVHGAPLDADALGLEAAANRPETAAARARIEAAAARVELARKAYGPDVTAGLTYSLVGRRDDAAGELNPPEDDGQDVLGVSAAVSLPIWRGKLAAGVEEATETRLAAEQSLRSTIAAIRTTVGDLAARIPLLQEEVELFGSLMLPQAEEALDSALAGYSAGSHGALDLLDSERVLLQVRIAEARARTDLAIALALLEGAVARPLEAAENGDRS